MAVTDFAITNSNIRLSGYWQNIGPFLGHTVYSNGTLTSLIDIAFTLDGSAGSTDVSFPFVYVGSTTLCQVSVDGGSFATPTIAGSGDYEIIPLATALAPGAHTITVKKVEDQTWFHDIVTSLRFSGAIPTLAMPSGFSTKTYSVPANTSPATLSNAYSQANAGHYYKDSYNLTELDNAGMRVLFTAHRFGCYRFKTTAGTGTVDIKVFQWGDNGDYTIRIDDNPDGVIHTFPNDGAWSWVTVISGLDATTAHTVSIYMDNICILGEIMFVGGGAADFDTAATFATRKRLAIYGDSYTEPTPESPLTNYGHYLGELLGSATAHSDYEVISKGIGGTAVANSISGSQAGETRTSDITGLSPQADLCVVLYGYNDTAETAPAYQAAEWNMLNLLTANSPSTKYIVPSTPPRVDNHDQVTTPVVADICTGSHGNGSGSFLSGAQITNIRYRDLTGAYLAGPSRADYTTNYNVDQVHPNKTGNQIIANWLFGDYLTWISPVLLFLPGFQGTKTSSPLPKMVAI